MKVADFDYILPDHLIAKRPLKDRTGSRLLVLHRDGSLDHKSFIDLRSYLNEGDMLIINNTKVFPARLSGITGKGGQLEILLTRKKDDNEWDVLSKGRYTGTLFISDDLRAEIYNGETARFYFDSAKNFMDIVWKYGSMPIPPYIKRLPDRSDKETYQTVFAREEGSIAAPTAGLHFTDALLKEMASQGVMIRELTLHVGIGTFKPVRTENVEDHYMDTEYFEIENGLIPEIEKAKFSGKRIFAVGTTTTRALEGYMSRNCSIICQNGKLRGATDIFIYPGYAFRIVDSLITNFHLPGSTPLMLASAKCGRTKLLNAYHEAVAAGYRFLSYGDAMLIL